MARVKGKCPGRKEPLSSSSSSSSDDSDSSREHSRKRQKVKDSNKDQGEEGPSNVYSVQDEDEDEDEDPSFVLSDEESEIIAENQNESKLFNEKAQEIKQALEEAVPGITITVNIKKLTKTGSFVIMAEGGLKVFKLMGMRRPFKKLKELDVAKTVSDIAAKIK
ncbi:hypothetical protein TanjilG_12510 [Lupinus angustifolius]|uniref:Uncharacterized protein n=1 Tax=Lupinus angustifolius TaxID=3871 RepID=A0A4P1QYN4_LUPAN|nr:hypothetical protein TanjilG_12510 [Lupinus angustifolius]